jgi:hypothetical protein
MKKLALLVLVAILSIELASAKVFYYDDEVDYRSNVNYALSHPWKGIDLDVVGDFDNYNCMSADDYNRRAGANQYDSNDELNARTASSSDLKKLRRADQLRIADENPYDNIDRDDFDDYSDWNCYTLKDYNSFARENSYDSRRVVDFTHFDDVNEIQKIGMGRYNNFFTYPDDFNNFNLQYTRAPKPYYEPYDNRDSPYPLYGYGLRIREDY